MVCAEKGSYLVLRFWVLVLECCWHLFLNWGFSAAAWDWSLWLAE